MLTNDRNQQTSRINIVRHVPPRSNAGQGIIALIAIGALIILPMLTALAFDIGRLYLAKVQLQNATDAAALTTAAGVASSDNTNPTNNHTDSMQAAIKIFKQNSVLGNSLSGATTVTSESDLACSIGQTKMFFEFLNPLTGAIEPINSPNGKVTRIETCTGCPTIFLKYFGISNFNVRVTADGAVPKLDVILLLRCIWLSRRPDTSHFSEAILGCGVG